MAERPIFVPNVSGTSLVLEVPVQFTWNPGMAPSQKKKNVIALHKASTTRGINPVLEISSKSEDEIGRALSSFFLKTRMLGRELYVECAFQGSKVFENGGPYTDLYDVEPREAKRDVRLRESGRLIAFRFEDEIYPLVPKTAFYDWIYINALYPRTEFRQMVGRYAGFSDIEFNPERSLNCQARTCATFLSLERRDLIDVAIESFGSFRGILEGSSI